MGFPNLKQMDCLLRWHLFLAEHLLTVGEAGSNLRTLGKLRPRLCERLVSVTKVFPAYTYDVFISSNGPLLITSLLLDLLQLSLYLLPRIP